MSDDYEDIQAIFFEEAEEGLGTAEAGLSAMADGDASVDVIAGVFRAVHSIKGGAGAFGHSALQDFAHVFENLLDDVRGEKIKADETVCRVMLSAFDVLSDHVGAARSGGSPPDDAAALASLQLALGQPAVGAGLENDNGASATTDDDGGFQPVAVSLDDLDGDGFDFQPVSAELDEFGLAEPAAWTIRFTPSREALANGGEPLLVIREVERLGGKLVSIDDQLPPLRELEPENSYLSYNLEAPGTVEETALHECFDFVPPSSVIEIQRDAPVNPAPVDAVALIDPVASDAIESTASAPLPAASESGSEAKVETIIPQTIRVDVTKLDMLLNLVGELVIRNSILSDRLSAADQQRVELPELARLTREIQDNVMSLRAQPVRQAFSRVPRIVRELCAETGKQVELEMVGETTEVDKGVIEKIGEPLTHMIRNAVDHGIELPEEREASGKSSKGVLQLSAEQKGARIFLRVKDDGRGIDRERVKAKAIEKGIISSDAQLTNEEIDNLICAPGFSTAETVSNISGRGVGMDVVRSNVEALGGRVEIVSVPGQGTTFTMVLPLTLAILDGMIVRVAGQRYVLPLASVVETVKPDFGQVSPVSPTSEVIELRGDFVPVQRATELFSLVSERQAGDDAVVIIVESEAGRMGLLVDTIEDRREVVIKSLDQNLYPIRGLGGATILGDGSIALILDIDALVASTATQAKFNLKGLAA
ncbi:chemotaxis protein CheA [Sphingorhabdus sp. M41]|uniref:chemotaxis protein CheA n=1 Tax=Sphingorhabdus sp. M41 TaxID=1806885 RepID=UPI00078E6E63|nr:chemotaxis protein CheA [Sphingorhabdus sp. M41]AMO72629.1 chemotaxis protein CheA [Sphingorhabdus sp. M41]